MKKNNVIIYILIAIVSVFLLWLWYFLGLNHVDSPLDLLLSVIWWIMIAVSIFVIVRAEKVRKERIRTVYVVGSEIFNSEAGMIKVNDQTDLTETIRKIVDELEYGFSSPDFPEKEEFSPRCLVRTSKMKDDEWEGTIVNVKTKEEFAFQNQDELATLLVKEGK